MNMSYCRFHNTRLDMDDCLDVLSGNYGVIESEEEKHYAIIMMRNVLDYFVQEGIVEEEEGAFDDWAEWIERLVDED